MNDTIQSYLPEFDGGVVTAGGFKVLHDAESYGAASSIGAAGDCLARLWRCLDNHPLILFVPGQGPFSVTTGEEFKDWCERHLPLSFGEFLLRSAQDRTMG